MSAVAILISPIKFRSKDLIRSGLRSGCQRRHGLSSLSSRHQVPWFRAAVVRDMQQVKEEDSSQRRHYIAVNQADNSSVESKPSQSLKPPINYDKAFFDLIRKRLEDKPDAIYNFKHCKEEPVRQAGVFMPLCIHKGVPSVLFTIRARNMRNHQGEVSFPGGKRDPADITVLDTALREMEEEISIPRDQVEVLGEYSTMPNKDCTLRVHPFVGFIKTPIEDIESIIFNADEVYKVFTVPMQDLVDPGKRSMVRFRNSQFLYPVWKIEEEDITIWGLTAFILDGVLRRIAKGGPEEASQIPEGVNVEKYSPPRPSS